MIGIKFLRKFSKNQSGLSLLEIVVAVSIFTALILSSTQIFQSVIQNHRQSIAMQNMQANLSYTFEVMSKEIRMAVKAEESGCITANSIYETSEDLDELFFLNQDEKCVSYYLVDDNGVSRLKIKRDEKEAFVTPSDLEVKDLQFFVDDDGQPRVTIMLDISPIDPSLSTQIIKIQTTISSRNYQ